MDNKIMYKRIGHQAVEQNIDNIVELCHDLSDVGAEVIRTYSDYDRILTSLKVIPEDKYQEHESTILECLEKIDIISTYLSFIKTDLEKYYKSDDYREAKRTKIREDIYSELKTELESNGLEVSSPIYSDVELIKKEDSFKPFRIEQ